MDNAICDWNLFHSLFIDLVGQQRNIHNSVSEAINFTKDNIRNALNTAAGVFSIHTGCMTAACLQVIERMDTASIEDAILTFP